MANIMNTKASDLTVKQNLQLTLGLTIVSLTPLAVLMGIGIYSNWKEDRKLKKDQES